MITQPINKLANNSLLKIHVSDNNYTTRKRHEKIKTGVYSLSYASFIHNKFVGFEPRHSAYETSALHTYYCVLYTQRT